MSSGLIPRSERLQKKVWEARDPDTKSKESKFYLVWFPNEFMYSVVEGKSIKEINPRIRDKVRVKDSAGTWEGIVYAEGSEGHCKDKQIKLERFCEHISDKDEDSTADEDDNTAIMTMKRKGKGSSGQVEKRKRFKELSSDDENKEESKDMKAMELDVRIENEKVKKLLCNSAKVTEKVEDITINSSNLEAMFLGCHRRMDQIIKLLEKLVDQKEVAQSSRPVMHSTPPSKPKTIVSQNTRVVSPSPQSSDNSMPSEDLTNDPDFIVDGTNLLIDVPFKAKKPTLYATSLMTYLFSDEEMREGCVEPREGNSSKKTPLDQMKINIIKKCIRIRCGEKMFDRNWPEVRKSMNQKCLDKLKEYRKLSASTAL